MRHLVKGRKLGRTSSHREALFRNQLQSLMDHERIITTLPKAKELRPLAERVITRGKQGTVHARRWALRWLLRRDLVKKLFDDIAPRFSERPGGYLRIVKLGPRQGDGAEMAVIEMVDRVAPAGKDKDAGGKGGAKGAKGAAKPARGKAGKAAGGEAGEAAAGAEAGEGEGKEKAAKTAKAKPAKGAKPAKAAAKGARRTDRAAAPPDGGRGKKDRDGGGGGKRGNAPRAGGGRKPSSPQKTV
jgi:large subunit ribosomal protein L17